MIVVRDAYPGDAFAMASINVRGWRESSRGAVADEVVDAQRVGPRQAWFEADLPAAKDLRTLVAEQDGVVVGFVHLGPGRDANAGGVPELWAIYVDPDHQRRGVGRLLLAAVEDDLDGSPATL
ncbi:GNAT family N-acetyltransferase [bacterium]|nr:GNAT family N-acetyltransferase [bacterium]